MRFFSASASDVGKKRKLNEDAFLDRSDLALWAVADGMGGHEAGEVASKLIIDTLAQLGSGGSLSEVSDRADKLLHDVNCKLLEMASGGDRLRTIGSTVVMLIVRDGQYNCLWAGDSRCYLVRDRAIFQLTQDHSLVWDLIRSGMLDKESAATHPDANVITRAIGARPELEIDSVSGVARGGDHFLIVSDGVTRKMEDEELYSVVAARNPMQAVQQITETVLERGAPDNLTSVLIRID